MSDDRLTNEQPRAWTSEPPLTDAQWRVLRNRTFPLQSGQRVALGVLGDRVRLFAPDGRCVLLLVADPEVPGHYGEPFDVLGFRMAEVRDWRTA